MRTRNGNPQDPRIERELAAVDATLGGQPVDAGMTELAELVLAVQAVRPRPRASFVEELAARAAAGFPRIESTPDTAQQPGKPAQTRFRFARALKARRIPLAFGTAASLLIVVTGLISSGVLAPETVEESASTDVAQEDVPSTAPRETLSREAGDAVQAEPLSAAPARGGGVLPQVHTRRQDRDAAIVLATPRADIEEAADGVIQVTDRYQGFVLRSNVTGGEEGRAGAALELRIPSEKLQPALRDLSELAHVRSRTQTTQDITARFVSARSRLNEATAERRALLRQLARASTPNEAASIRARLRIANRQITQARSNLRSLRNRVDFSSVSVAIEADESAKAADGGWSPGDALDDAVGILKTTLGILLVSLAVLLPLTALGLVAWLVSSRFRTARRERALDRQAA